MTWLKEQFSFHDIQRLLFKLTERVKVFRDLSGAEIVDLLGHAEKCLYQPGMDIVNEGNVGQHMYLIIDGEARVSKHGRDGEVELARLGPADSFGEMALADQDTRSATVTALDNCVLVRISEQAINAKPEIGMKVYRNIARLLSERLRTADEQLAWRL